MASAGLVPLVYKCAACFTARSALLICSGCRCAHYCSPECQRKDWTQGHKVFCLEMRKKLDKKDTASVIERNRRIVGYMIKAISGVPKLVMGPLIKYLRTHRKECLVVRYTDTERKPDIEKLKYSILMGMARVFGVPTPPGLSTEMLKLEMGFSEVQIETAEHMEILKQGGLPIIFKSNIGNCESTGFFRFFYLMGTSGPEPDGKNSR